MKIQDSLPFILNLFLFCAGEVCIICTENIVGIHCHNADIASTTFICQEINSVLKFDISSSHSNFICEQSGSPIYVEGDPCPTSTTFLPDVCIICTKEIIGMHCHNADITSITFICQEINYVFKFDIASSHSNFICEQTGTSIYVKGGPCPTSTTVLPGATIESVTTTAPPGLTGGEIFGIIFAVIVGIAVIVVVVWYNFPLHWDQAVPCLSGRHDQGTDEYVGPSNEEAANALLTVEEPVSPGAAAPGHHNTPDTQPAQDVVPELPQQEEASYQELGGPAVDAAAGGDISCQQKQQFPWKMPVPTLGKDGKPCQAGSQAPQAHQGRSQPAQHQSHPLAGSAGPDVDLGHHTSSPSSLQAQVSTYST